MSGSTPADVLTLTTDPDDALALMGDSNRVVRDDFAGPGGWSTGIADLLKAHDLVEVALEWDASACLTRVANGHVNTLRADVAAYPVAPFLGRTIGYIGSPPCQTFSMAGNGSGRAHLDLLCECVRGILLGRLSYDEAMARLEAAGALDDKDGNPDPRNGLILIPARVIRALLDHDGQGPTNLEWVALEQVPTAAPVFRAYAMALRELGFSAAVEVLNAADYGVPQTRERVFVLASRVRRVAVPEPTHAKGGEPEGLFGPSRLPWISMARALGWVATVAHKRGAGMAERHGEREPRPTTEPAPTITGGSPRRLAIEGVRLTDLSFCPTNLRPNAAIRSADQPASTIAVGHETPRWVTPEELAAYRATLEARLNAGTVTDAEWCEDRPATTVVGSFCPDDIAAPGYRVDVSRQDAPGSLRITEAEGGILQGFPADYRWEGKTKGKRWEQIGNVVCPPVARRNVAQLLGEPMPDPLPWHAYAWASEEELVPFG